MGCWAKFTEEGSGRSQAIKTKAGDWAGFGSVAACLPSRYKVMVVSLATQEIKKRVLATGLTCSMHGTEAQSAWVLHGGHIG